MNNRLVVMVLLFCVIISSGYCEVDVDGVRAAMRRSAEYMRSISTNGGWCGFYSLDLKKRYGEALYDKARIGEIWVQPPGTPSVGLAFLRAFRATGEKFYLDGARQAARALVWGQRLAGGWNYRVDVSRLSAAAVKPVRKKGFGTFDDKTTQGAIEFLIEMDKEIDEDWLTEGVELGLKFVQQAQFSNGAWPQWYPLAGGYRDYYTFNDNAINDCIALMLKAHKVYGKDEYLRCARRGADFIVTSQGKGQQAGWAQQYSHDMKPAKARSFEPAGICSAVTGRNIRTLVDVYLYTKDEKYLVSISRAIKWLDGAKVGKNLWARLYEVGSDRPIYGDRNKPGKVIYDYEKVSQREKKSYSWQGVYGITSAVRYYQQVKQLGADEYLSSRAKANGKRPGRVADIESVVKSLDDKGRWIDEKNMITSRLFVVNFNKLCSFVEGTK